MAKKILIVGGSGFVGTALRKKFPEAHYTTRHPAKNDSHAIYWDYKKPFPKSDYDIVINLLGHPVQEFLLHPKKVYDTRVISTKNLRHSFPKLNCYICASAIGIYAKGSFLSKVLQDTEKEAKKISARNVRLRFAPIIGKNSTFTQVPFLPIIKDDICPWVHIDDVVTAVDYVIKHDISGAHTVVSPSKISWKTFVTTFNIKHITLPKFLRFIRGPTNALFVDAPRKSVFTYKHKRLT